MVKTILAFLLVPAVILPVSGQVEKEIHIKSIPEVASVTTASGRASFIGHTPLNYSFSFHSDISVLKIKLAACGFYDTIVKVSTSDDTLRIVLEKKRLLLLPESQDDTINSDDYKRISAVANNILDDFSVRNLAKPVNFADFAIVKARGEKKYVTLIFEAEPAFMTLPKAVKSDSLLMNLWTELFSSSQAVLNSKRTNYPRNTDFYFSLISGKKNLSVRQLPGVEVSDELKSETYVYEDDYKRVTTTTLYYETVTNPTFNSSVSQSQKYSEVLFRVTPGKGNIGYILSGTAAISYTNEKMSVLFESEPGLSSSSMVTRYTGSKR